MATSSMTLDELVSQLRQVHGDLLQTVVLYGSAASDEQVKGHSDLNVLVIVRSLELSTLRTLAQTTRAWHEAGNPAPLTLTTAEWLRSADIFPMEYADILERHRVLDGALPLDGIVVNARDLRLQVEQEAMGKLLRLRRGVMSSGTDGAKQSELLRVSLSALLVIFRAVLRLHNERPPRDAVQLVHTVGQRCGFDATSFEHVAALVRGKAIEAGKTESILAGYVHGMESLVTYLDQFTPPAPSADSQHS